MTKHNDSDLREALRRKYSQTPQLSDDFTDRVMKLKERGCPRPQRERGCPRPQQIENRNEMRAGSPALLKRAGSPALPAGLTAMRIILTSAAVYLTGLFLWLQQEPAEPVRLANNEQPVQETVVPCTEGTPDEIIMCYLEQRETRPNTYNLIRRMLYENKQ